MNRLQWSAVLAVLGALSFAGASRAETNSAFTALALESLLDKDGNVWQLPAGQFMDAHATNGFEWVSDANRDAARSVNPRLTFLGKRVWETIARFSNGQFGELTLSLYNRGDAGNLSDRVFQDFMVDIDQRLTEWAGAKGVSFKDEERTTRAIVRRKSWVREPHYRMDMTWGFTQLPGSSDQYRPEFVRLQIARFNPAEDPRRMFFGPIVNKTKMLTVVELRANVKRLPSGDVFIAGIPMVDQGEKGYCATAVAERVLRYFETKVDEHEIAQLANTSAQRGTTAEALLKAIQNIGSSCGLDVTVLQQFTADEFLKMVDEYNRQAKHAKSDEIQLDFRRPVYVNDVYAEMKPQLFREARLHRDAGMPDLKNAIRKYVNSGVPLEWPVFLGMVTEKPPIHGTGGHMRLIVGYNEAKNEVLYSDTWGVGHELKRMSLADAWTITTGLYVITPSNVRVW